MHTPLPSLYRGQRVLGILRSKDALLQLVYQPPLDGEARPPLLVPLAPRDAPTLCRAWEKLGAANLEGPSLPEALSLVLAHSLPMEGLDWKSQLPPAPKKPEPPRPTAAHPRAYRGTKYKPPKPPEPEPIDLRPYLGSWRVERQWLSRLGLPPEDPYFLENFYEPNANRDAYSEEFVHYLLPCLKGNGSFAAVGSLWASVLQWKSLSPENWSETRQNLMALFVEGIPPEAVSWAELLTTFGPKRAEEALSTLIRVGAHRSSCRLSEEDILRFLMVTPDDLFSPRLEALLRGSVAMAGFPYLESGFVLANRYDPAHDFREIPPGQEAAPLEVIDTLLKNGEEAFSSDSGRSFWVLDLWRYCGKLPGLEERLGELARSSLRERALYRFVKLLCSFWFWSDDWRERWSFLHKHSPRLLQLAEPLDPSYQEKFLEEASYWFWEFDNEPLDFLPLWSEGLPILLQRARAPFSPKACGEQIVWAFVVKGYPDTLKRLEDTPPESWKSLERAARRRNDEGLIAVGVGALCLDYPEFSIRAFFSCPGIFLESARWLGALLIPQRDEALSPLAAHPLWNPDCKGWPLKELVSAIDEASTTDLGIVPRAVRRFLGGEKNLTPGQRERHREVIFSRLDILRCHLVRQSSERILSRSMPGYDGTPQSRHALAMRLHAGKNRRSLTRLIRERFAGGLDAERRHPISRQWLARHPRLDESL